MSTLTKAAPVSPLEAVKRRYYNTDATFGMETMSNVFVLDRFREIAQSAVVARQDGDLTELGRLMSEAWRTEAIDKARGEISDMEVG